MTASRRVKCSQVLKLSPEGGSSGTAEPPVRLQCIKYVSQTRTSTQFSVLLFGSTWLIHNIVQHIYCSTNTHFTEFVVSPVLYEYKSSTYSQYSSNI